jgi:uncharacterized protein YerC
MVCTVCMVPTIVYTIDVVSVVVVTSTSPSTRSDVDTESTIPTTTPYYSSVHRCIHYHRRGV